MNSHSGNLTEYLIKNNIKPSFQRLKILEYLVNKNNHPTVDEVYGEVVKEVSTLSKTTVYSTMNLFLKADILNGLYIEENEIRYDSMLSKHGHFKCKKCGKIYDFKIDIDLFEADDLNKFQIEEKDVYFKGICSNCA